VPKNGTWLDHLSLAVFLGRSKPDQVKSSAIKFLAQSLMQFSLFAMHEQISSL
jgi:hypothetical protein